MQKFVKFPFLHEAVPVNLIVNGVREFVPSLEGAMQSYRESIIEFADFTFERQKVVCYGLQNNAGGTTTVLNFPSERLANEFREVFLSKRDFRIIQNDAQLICLADYDTVMRKSDNDPRVRCLNHNRDFLMGTLAHMS